MKMDIRGKSKVMNMTEGNPLKLIAVFAVPMLIGNLFQQLYNLADSIIVGKLIGGDALASVGATNSITFLFFALCNGIGSGGGIITSQYFGRGDEKDTKESMVNTGYLMFVVPFFVGILAFLLAKPILLLLNTPANILPNALAYMKINCVGIIFVSLYNYASSMLRALGDSKTPLYFLVVSCFINIILDFIFVYFFHLGVAGAAYATIISQLLSGIACFIYALNSNPYFKFTKENMKYNHSIIIKVVKLGVPLSLQFSLIAISCMALQRVVNGFGEVAMAAFTATSRIEQLIHQPYQTLGASLSTFTGQNFGAGKKERVIKGYHLSLLIMLIFSVAMLPLMQIFGDSIMKLFVDEADVIAMGGQALRITSFFYVFLGVIYVVRGVLNGLGDAFFALLNGIVEVIGRFTVPILLTGMSIFGLWGIWWSVGIVWFISGFTAWLRYLQYSKKYFNKETTNQ